jgi:hypothetical protein
LEVWNHQVARPKPDLITSRLSELLFVPIGSLQLIWVSFE